MEQSYVYLVYKSSCSLSQFLLYGVPVLGVSVAGELCHCQGVVEGDGWFRPEVLHEPTRIQSFGIQNTYVHVHVLVLLHVIVHVRTCACTYMCMHVLYGIQPLPCSHGYLITGTSEL